MFGLGHSTMAFVPCLYVSMQAVWSVERDRCCLYTLNLVLTGLRYISERCLTVTKTYLK